MCGYRNSRAASLPLGCETVDKVVRLAITVRKGV